jgi:prepilin-type N-terminal cleavage/methylation domain-containing protein
MHTTRGFSLIEVMVASALFLLSVVGVISTANTANGIFAHQRILTQALSVGEFALEELLLRYNAHADLVVNGTKGGDGRITTATPRSRCLGPDLLTAGSCVTRSFTPKSAFANAASFSVGDGSTSYGVNWVVAPVAGLATQRHIFLVVAWLEGGAVKTVELQTYRP